MCMPSLDSPGESLFAILHFPSQGISTTQPSSMRTPLHWLATLGWEAMERGPQFGSFAVRAQGRLREDPKPLYRELEGYAPNREGERESRLRGAEPCLPIQGRISLQFSPNPKPNPQPIRFQLEAEWTFNSLIIPSQIDSQI